MTVPFEDGDIDIYIDRCLFVAYCGCPRHTDGMLPCYRSRTARGGRIRAQGRPLGHLAAWLRFRCHNRGGHMLVAARDLGQAARVQARNDLQAVAGSDVLFASERPLKAGEPPEPVGAV